jgi:hypothetical protein
MPRLSSDGSIAGAGRGIAQSFYAVAAAIGIRRTSLAATASTRAREVGQAIHVVLTGGRDATKGHAHLTGVTAGRIHTSWNASLGATRSQISEAMVEGEQATAAIRLARHSGPGDDHPGYILAVESLLLRDIPLRWPESKNPEPLEKIQGFSLCEEGDLNPHGC